MPVNKKILLPAILILVGVTAVIAFTTTNNANSKTSTISTPQPTPDNVSLLETLPTDLMTLSQFQSLATKESPNNPITVIEFEKEAGEYVYEAKYLDGKVIYFNARTGAIVKSFSVERKEGVVALPANVNPAIGFEKARQLAAAEKPDTTVTKLELEMEDGKVIYSIAFANKAKIHLDATSGQVL